MSKVGEISQESDQADRADVQRYRTEKSLRKATVVPGLRRRFGEVDWMATCQFLLQR